MDFEILVKIIRDTLTTSCINAVDFVWHGGEVTLLRPSFLKRALWLEEYFRRPNVQILNSIQTNATRLTDEWIIF